MLRNGGYGKAYSTVGIHGRDFAVNKTLFLPRRAEYNIRVEKNIIMALCSGGRSYKRKPKPLSKTILNTCTNLKQKMRD